MSSEIPGAGGDNGDKTEASPVSTYAGVGLQFAISLILFVFAGKWVDGKLGTTPIFLLVGVFGGAAASFYSMYRKLMAPYSRKPEKR